MKKKFFSIALLAIVLSVSSCNSSSSFDSDVRKMADYRCKMQKLMATGTSDEKVQKELEVLQKEMETFADKMEEKYKDKKDDKAMEAKAEAIMKEVMDKCK